MGYTWLAYTWIRMQMVFKETSHFPRAIVDLMSDEEYSLLQLHLMAHPDSGSFIPGTGGLRKVAGVVPK